MLRYGQRLHNRTPPLVSNSHHRINTLGLIITTPPRPSSSSLRSQLTTPTLRLVLARSYSTDTSSLYPPQLYLRRVLSSASTRGATPLRPALHPAWLGLVRRSFHSSRPRHDVLFVSVPALKAALLTVVRVSLIFLPFAWRWGFFKRFPKGAWRMGGIPLLATCLVLALGLNQSEKTARWRLLLMSEREELEWSNTRFEEIITTDEVLLVPPEDPRVVPIKAVIERLIRTLNDNAPLSCVSFPKEEMVSKVKKETKRSQIVPSARIEVATVPWMPESSNPEKQMPRGTWDLFLVDLPKINAFVLPSKDIFVYSGLLSVVEDDENLLAAVLAHECIHLVERHSVEELGFLALSGVVFDVLRGTAWALTLSFPMVGDALSAFFTFVDRKVGQRAYSRRLETEADELGLELMARAGFDPRASITLWEILNEVEKDVQERGEHGTITDHIALLRTHPTGEARLENLKRCLPKAIEIYDQTLKEAEGRGMAEERMKELVKEHQRITDEEDEKRRAAISAAAAARAMAKAKVGPGERGQVDRAV